MNVSKKCLSFKFRDINGFDHEENIRFVFVMYVGLCRI